MLEYGYYKFIMSNEIIREIITVHPSNMNRIMDDEILTRLQCMINIYDWSIICIAILSCTLISNLQYNCS